MAVFFFLYFTKQLTTLKNGIIFVIYLGVLLLQAYCFVFIIFWVAKYEGAQAKATYNLENRAENPATSPDNEEPATLPDNEEPATLPDDEEPATPPDNEEPVS